MLVEIYDLTTSKSTLVYIGASFGFVIGTPLANIFIKKEWTTRRGLSYIGLNVLAVGMVIRTGDFGDQPKLWLSVIGQMLSGVGMAVLFCTSMPELVDSIEMRPELHKTLDKDKLIMYCSSLFTLVGAIG